MELYNALFLIQLFVSIGILLSQLYNLMHKAEKWDFRVSIILFIGYALAWLGGLSVLLLNPTEGLFLLFFKLESVCFILSFVFFVSELFFLFGSSAQSVIKAHNSKMESRL